MTLPIEQLQDLLLDMISGRRAAAPARAAQLGPEDWTRMLGMVHQHRLGPLLHSRLADPEIAAAVPAHVRQALAESFHQSTLRALRFQRELLLLRQILARVGIASIALKGAFLALHAYPHPALRPMRDLDLLVRQDQGLAAYQALLAAGYRRLDAYQGDPAANLALHKHLPPLRSAQGRVTVELHVRLSEPDHAVRVDESTLWQRIIERDIAGQTVAYLSPTDLLLHLICHAVYDHRFDNGPLVLSDLAYLIGAGEVDWPLFWRQAQAGGATRGCVLLLKMTHRYFDGTDVDFSGLSPDQFDGVDIVVAKCSRLMLCDLDDRSDTKLASILAGRPMRQQAAIFLARLLPPKAKIAASFPASTHRFSVWTNYYSHAARIITRRLPQYLARRRQVTLAGNVRTMLEMDRWLGQLDGNVEK